MPKIFFLVTLPLLFLSADILYSQEFSRDKDRKNEKTKKNEGGKRKQNLASLPIPPSCWNKTQIILGRPMDTCIDFNILSPENTQGFLHVGEKSHPVHLKAGVVSVFRLKNLTPNTAYSYSLSLDKQNSPIYRFHTQRKSASDFTFAIQGDSHPERGHQNNANIYEKTLLRIASEKPDFFICLGDDFSVDHLREKPNQEAVDRIYHSHRPWLSLVNAPIFLVNGNHEQAAKCNLDGSENNVAVWAQNAREKYYSQPKPEGIYTGNTQQVKHIGYLRNYFAWDWGDALFVVIDPYWHSTDAVDNKFGTRDKTNNTWNTTIGKNQYQWLKSTLENSKAKYKFIFTHHVNGTGRGGVEAAHLYEWGGNDKKGSASFSINRPDWESPIHNLFVKHKVSAVFQGHDHVFAHQELDGIVYQTLPLPAGNDESLENVHAYKEGKVLMGSGFIKVHVTPQKATVYFMKNGTEKSAYSYQIEPKK